MIDAGAVLRAGRRPEIVAALCVGLLVFLLYHLTRFSLSTVWPLVPRGDAWIIYESSRAVFAASDYPRAWRSETWMRCFRIRHRRSSCSAA